MTRQVRYNRRPKGGLTIFAALSFMLIAQFLFTLAEGARQMELVKVADMTTDCAAESLLAGYCRPLWEDYHLLGYDGSGSDTTVSTTQMGEYVKAIANADFQTGDSLLWMRFISLLRLDPTDVCFDSYTLLTDGNGSAYVNTVSAYMENNLVYEEAKKIYNQYESMQKLEENSDFDFGSIEGALKLLESSSQSEISSGSNTSPSYTSSPSSNTSPSSSASSSSTASSSESSSSGSASGEASENLLSEVNTISAKGILKLVLPSSKSVSGLSMDLSKVVSKRSLETGVSPSCTSPVWYDTVLLQQYLTTYLGDYSNPAEDHALSYELEYLIGQKSSDEANLKAVVTELLAVREAANMAYLAGDSTKMAELEAAAGAIATASGLPILTEAVKIGLMAAWAYVESILDVRALMDGDKIALLKSSNTWTSDLEHIADLLKGQGKAISSDSGLSYKGYLGLLLFTKSSNTLAMKAMDVQEAAIQKKEHYSSFQMDHAICSLSITVGYSYQPIFLSFVNLIQTGQKDYSITSKSSYSYLKP